MDYKGMAQMLGFLRPGSDHVKGSGSSHPKTPRAGDFVGAIKRGMGRPKRHPSDRPVGIPVRSARSR